MIKTKVIDIPEDVMRVLAELEVEGNVVRIVQQLDRDLYVRVNKVLEAIGGKWNRKVRGHIFEGDPSEKIREAIESSRVVNVKKTVEFFETPTDLAHQLVEMAAIGPMMKILEPSAGRGAIADAIREACPDCPLEVVEVETSNRKVLKEKGHRLVGKDFLKFRKKGGYDRIVMNPPFSRQQDIAHVTKAFGLLAPGGRLVSVMSAGVKFRQDKKALAFRELVDDHGVVEDLPPESFIESGTGVNAVVVTLDKP